MFLASWDKEIHIYINIKIEPSALLLYSYVIATYKDLVLLCRKMFQAAIIKCLLVQRLQIDILVIWNCNALCVSIFSLNSGINHVILFIYALFLSGYQFKDFSIAVAVM